MENLKYTEILQANKTMASKLNGKPYRIGVLANVTINSFKEIVEYSCRTNQIVPDIEIGNFDNIVQDSASYGNKELVIIFYDVLNIVDSVYGFFEDIDDEAYNGLKKKICSEINITLDNLKSVPSVIFNTFSSAYFIPQYDQSSRLDRLVKELNEYLEANKTGNVTLIDIDKIFRHTGLKQNIDFRFYNSSKAPYTVGFFKQYVSAIEHTILRNTGKLKKAIIFDCDNTLWKGIIGEDGIDGIDMDKSSGTGKFYSKVQEIIVYLSKRGIIVGVCSKNNEQDVIEVLLNHQHMILKDKHIVVKKINWQDKVTNLKAMATELNIGIDTFVFVDDSHFEINLIKEQLPEVMALQVPDNISEYPDFLLKNIYKYFNLAISNDDTRKTEMYKQQYEREAAKTAAGSLTDYLASLEIVITISHKNKDVVPRIAQLTQKTNQFNLTTKRYTESQIQEFMDDKNSFVFSMDVKDKFGDSGLTGICIAQQDKNDPATVVIDSLLMSCRVIGRNIEYAFVDYIIKFLAGKGYKFITADYIPTKKNAQVESFYEELKFTVTGLKEGVKQYVSDLAKYQSKTIEYITINHF